MDNEFFIDLPAICRALDEVEIVLIRFELMDQRLLFDLRSRGSLGPLVSLVERVSSMEERIRTLMRLRPDFPTPERIKILRWPRYVGSLAALGLWQRLEERCARSGHPEALDQCHRLFRQLQAEERRLIQAAVLGEGFRTIWARS